MNKELLEAIKEASISIACCLDDINEVTEKDLTHIQDQITIIENQTTVVKNVKLPAYEIINQLTK